MREPVRPRLSWGLQCYLQYTPPDVGNTEQISPKLAAIAMEMRETKIQPQIIVTGPPFVRAIFRAV
jgi:hypothetical protein